VGERKKADLWWDSPVKDPGPFHSSLPGHRQEQGKGSGNSAVGKKETTKEERNEEGFDSLVVSDNESKKDNLNVKDKGQSS